MLKHLPRPVWPRTLTSALLLLTPFNLLASLGMDIYLPAVPGMSGALSTTPGVVQLTLSLYMVTLGIGQMVFGPLSDRIGRRPVLLMGGLLFTGTSLMLATAASGGVFLALRLLQAIGASAALVAVFATVRDVYAERSEGILVYSWLNGMLAFVPALGPVLGAVILQALGWRALFVALAAAAGLALLQAWLGWGETRSAPVKGAAGVFPRILRDKAFWVYTTGFSAAMGSFFVFFSTAPRVLIGGAGYSELQFSLAFATTAGVLIATGRLARASVARWGTAGSAARGMVLLLLGATLLAAGQALGSPSFVSFVLPMWVVCIGVTLTASVTANGALAAFQDAAGAAVAAYFCVQSLIVGAVGTACILMLGGDTAWPLVGYAGVLSATTLAGLTRLRCARPAQDAEPRWGPN